MRQFETVITPLQLGDNQIVLTARRFPDVEVETVVRFNVVNCAYTEDFNETSILSGRYTNAHAHRMTETVLP